MPDFKAVVRSAFANHGRTPDPDVVEELAQHAAAEWEAARADGAAEAVATARVCALVALWCNHPRVGRHRPARPVVIEPPAASASTFAGLVQDAQYAVRLLRRQPGYAAVAILTMALSIGSTTVLFSVAYGVLLKPLPWPESDQIVRVVETRKGQPGRIPDTITNGSYLAWSEQPSTIEALGGYRLVNSRMTIQRPGSQEPVRVLVGSLTPSMFQVLKASPLRGRIFEPGDALVGGGAYPTPRVVVLSFGLWRDLYGGREDAIGSAVRVDDTTVTIIGVMPPDFAFPDRATRAWLPMPVPSVLGDNDARRVMIFAALARLRPGVSLTQAALEGTADARTAPDPGNAAVSMFGSAAPPDISVTPVIDIMTADIKPALSLLLVAAVLLLATATANVGGLQLARATTRRREIAVRAAIGAGVARLARQLIVESALIGIAGGMAGLLLAVALQGSLPLLLPADFPRRDEIAMNGTVLMFAVAMSVAASVVCGLLPALQLRQINLVEAIAEEGGTSTSSGWRSGPGRLRSWIMVGQMAVACVLLVGAALLGRSFVALMHADRGYDPSDLLTARVDLGAAYDGPRRVAFADAIVERLQSVPGVSQVAAGNALPFESLGGTVGFTMPSPSNPAIKQQVQTLTRLVSPAYFQTLRLRLRQGRVFTDADTALSRPVVVVNRSFAQRYLGASPIGMRMPMAFGEGRPDCDVVGVVDDMRQSNVTEPPAPELFVSYRQMPARLRNSPLMFVVRTPDDPLALVPTLRAVVREKDPAVALDSVMTMEERVMTNLAKPRLYAVLLGALGSFALVIAGVGLFGALSFVVAQRSREFGVRTALGAQSRDIMGLVFKHAAAIAVSGMVLGLAASFMLSRLLAILLYGITPYDTKSFAVAAVILAAVAGLAAFVPARRATKVDPLNALKST
jgi:putative ABC transport system permease protein